MKPKLFNFARKDKKDKVKHCCKGILCFCFLSISITVFSQETSRFLHTYQPQNYHYVDTDTLRNWYVDNFPNLVIVTMFKTNGEYFELSDTAYRDYILLDGKKYLMDSLYLRKYDDYAISFEYGNTHYIQHKQIEYLIIEGINSFQYGTLAQPFYMIFQKKDREYRFLSSYIISDVGFYDEEIINSVKVIFESIN